MCELRSVKERQVRIDGAESATYSLTAAALLCGGGFGANRWFGHDMLIRNFIFWLSSKRGVTNAIARRGMKYGFARRFVAGETLAEALTASDELCRAGRHVSLNHLGENVTTEAAAREVCASYLEMTEQMHAKNLAGNISIKLTQLGLDLSKELCGALTLSIAKRAAELGRTIEMDMEGSVYTDATLDIFESTQRETGNCGLAIQAYLHRTEKDIQRLALLRPKIRLVKGAYREPANIAVQGKPAVDANYRKLTTLLLEGAKRGLYFPAIASHDPFMVAHAQSEAARLGLPKDKYELQMIYGIRRDLQQQARDAGNILQVYVPFGTDWCPYFMRRLSERPANCWFVLRSLVAESSS
jgi:proline dehydrogenase